MKVLIVSDTHGRDENLEIAIVIIEFLYPLGS